MTTVSYQPNNVILIPGAGSTPAAWDSVVANLPEGLTIHAVDHLALGELKAIAAALIPGLLDRFAFIGHRAMVNWPDWWSTLGSIEMSSIFIGAADKFQKLYL